MMEKLPEHLIKSAHEIGEWFETRNISSWIIGPCASRGKNESLQARIAELEAENDILRKLQGAHRVSEIEAQLAASQLREKQLREAWNAIEIDSDECLDFDECTAMLVQLDTYNAMAEAVGLPTSTEALDAYVAKKVKEAIK